MEMDWATVKLITFFKDIFETIVCKLQCWNDFEVFLDRGLILCF